MLKKEFPAFRLSRGLSNDAAESVAHLWAFAQLVQASNKQGHGPCNATQGLKEGRGRSRRGRRRERPSGSAVTGLKEERRIDVVRKKINIRRLIILLSPTPCTARPPCVRAPNTTPSPTHPRPRCRHHQRSFLMLLVRRWPLLLLSISFNPPSHFEAHTQRKPATQSQKKPLKGSHSKPLKGNHSTCQPQSPSVCAVLQVPPHPLTPHASGARTALTATSASELTSINSRPCPARARLSRARLSAREATTRSQPRGCLRPRVPRAPMWWTGRRMR